MMFRTESSIRSKRTLFLMFFAGLVSTAFCYEGSVLLGQDAGQSEFSVKQFATKFCLDCHSSDSAEGEFDLEQMVQGGVKKSDYERWQKFVQRIEDLSMPPEDNDMPTMPERLKVAKKIEGQLEKLFCGEAIQPGPLAVRRLSRTEYADTIRDLLGISIDVSSGLPEEGAGGEGFDNAAETLFISPIHAEKFLAAASQAVDYAIKDPRSRSRMLAGSFQLEGNQKVRPFLNVFLPRAFRRRVTGEEVTTYERLFQKALKTSGSRQKALALTVKAILVSPNFLFITQRFAKNEIDQKNSYKVRMLDDFSIASRLSYFLWGSMPDKKLFRLAEKGKLNRPEVLQAQVVRMIQAKIQGRPKVREFADSFVHQWLETRRLGREFVPDKKVAPKFDSELLGGMRYEPVFFFEDLIVANRSTINLLKSDYTFVNRRLARHYRIGGEFREQPKRTQLKPGGHRGGVLSMAAVLAVSSYPHRTSPVLRGKYVLETILGQSTPPPPADVPPLKEEKVKTPASLRKQLELHRANTACASCHDQMDPLGFGLENFDLLGRYRTRTSGARIDSKGRLPDGTEFQGFEGLQKVLLKRKDQFHRHLTEKLLGFGLARGLRPEDRCVAKEIAASNAKQGYKTQDLLIRIVQSELFRKAVQKEIQK